MKNNNSHFFQVRWNKNALGRCKGDIGYVF